METKWWYRTILPLWNPCLSSLRDSPKQHYSSQQPYKHREFNPLPMDGDIYHTYHNIPHSNIHLIQVRLLVDASRVAEGLRDCFRDVSHTAIQPFHHSSLQPTVFPSARACRTSVQHTAVRHQLHQPLNVWRPVACALRKQSVRRLGHHYQTYRRKRMTDWIEFQTLIVSGSWSVFHRFP